MVGATCRVTHGDCIDFAQLYIYMAQVEMKRLELQDKVATQFNLVVFEGDRNEALSFGKHLERGKKKRLDHHPKLIKTIKLSFDSMMRNDDAFSSKLIPCSIVCFL